MKDIQERAYITTPATIAEMEMNSTLIDVPFAPGVDVEALTKDDPDPLFVTVEVLNPQVSKNKNNWTIDMLHDVAKQINESRPNGYMGHLDEAEMHTKNPETVTIWLGAKVVETDSGPKLFAKGYVLPTTLGTSFKTYLRKAKAAAKQVAVSVFGLADKKWNDIKKAYDIRSFDLESIDWARHGKEGIAGMSYYALASEMENNNNLNNPMDKIEVIKEMKVDDLKEHNPAIVQSIISEQASSHQTVVSEMEQKIAKANENNEAMYSLVVEMEVDNLLNAESLNNGVKKIIKEMVMEEITNDPTRPEGADGGSDEQVDAEGKKKAVKTAAKETASKAVKKVKDSEEGKALVKEMTASVRQPVNNNAPVEGSLKYTKDVE